MADREREAVVVVGGNPSGTRAAAAFALEGHPVVLLEPGDHAGGTANPGIVAESYRSFDRGPQRTLERRILGTRLDPLPPVLESRALFFERRLRTLPLEPVQTLRMFDPLSALVVGLDLFRTRGRRRFPSLLGSWMEVRSYRDWVRYHLGEALYERVLNLYALRRWGPPGELSANLARRAHGGGREHPGFYARRSPERTHRKQLEMVRGRGEVRLRSPLGSIVCEGGRAVGVRIRGTGETIRGRVVVARPPAEVVRSLGAEATPELRRDAARLPTRHAVAVQVSARASRLPFEVHVAEATTPFFRVLRPDLLPGGNASGSEVVCHLRLDADDPLWRLDDSALGEAVAESLEHSGLVEVVPHPPQVQRFPHFVPAPRLDFRGPWTRIRSRYDELGILGVGPAGAYGPLDHREELALLGGVLVDNAPDQASIHRRMVQGEADADGQAQLVERLVFA